MIYTHVLNRGGRGVRSPADRVTHQTDVRETDTAARLLESA